jgi:translation elongation factor EF-1beta
MQIPDFCFEGLSIQPVTRSLIEHLLANQPVTPEEAISFGVHTVKHYEVLQAIVQDACQDIEMVEDEIAFGFSLLQMHQVFADLDDAQGSSDKLNQLLYTYAPGYIGYVQFQTTRDLLLAHKGLAS